MKRKKSSEDIASEPYTSRGDDASGTFCSMEKYLSANLCCNNRWRYNRTYRQDASIGSGSTAAAIRHERMTGERVRSKLHSQKGIEYTKKFEKWLEDHPIASHGDRAAAENIIKDLKNALE